MQFHGVPASYYNLMPVFPTNQGTPQGYSSLHRPSLALTSSGPTNLAPVLQLLGMSTLFSPDTHKATESYLCKSKFKQIPQVAYSFLSSHTASTCCGMQQLLHPSIPSPCLNTNCETRIPPLLELWKQLSLQSSDTTSH